MKNKPTVSLIIATYNWPQALELCLMSISSQTILPDEVVIADDGSNKETTDFITKVRKTFPCPVVHVWHEDIGFRLTVIRNRAIARASGDYILQIDGDVILENHFIQDHLKMALENCFATGSRIMMTEELSHKLLKEKTTNITPFTKGLRNRQNACRLSLLSNYFRFRYKKDSPYYMKGCNMAFWKKDLIAVNGYNEDMTGWGYEDNEIAARLINLGIRKQYLKFGGIVYHIFHPLSSHDRKTINSDIFKKAVENKTVYCENGLNKYL
ncbi:glycosyltransferase family 2 protein [Prevotella sp. 10(H)]|uniref:glycosyltransferase family 2 protein n=1 Tax=Prevotella sp. 10(H) TaxID=1158294 RepID=UPI0004A6B81B|nr:glycosyltransferase family 2 protein [Prevotella sp. 10(H)]